MNRDQTIIKTIQETIEIASEKIEKTIKRDTVHAAQKQNRPAACSATFSWARGPTANGRAAESARRGAPPFPSWAEFGPTGAAELSRPSDQIRRPSASSAGSKPPATPFAIQTLGHSPPLLSPRERRQPRSGGDVQAERAGRRRRGLLAGARSPEGERAAVELAVDGATLSSPACATPASRSGKPVASLCREVRQARPAHRRRQ